MKKNLGICFLGLSVLVNAAGALALAETLQFGAPAYGGSGCPNGDLRAFVAEAGGGTGRTLDRKSCSVAVPVQVPAGYSVGISGAEILGEVDLPRGARAALNAELFFAGSRGPVAAQNYAGPARGPVRMSIRLGGSGGTIWSPCGSDVNLRMNASLTVSTNSRRQSAWAVVDHLGDSRYGGLPIRVQLKRCR